MKRLLAFLTSIVFLIISQAGLIHASDMRIFHDDMSMKQSKMFTPKADIFCSKSLSSNEASCFQEIPESKWIASGTYKIIEIFQILFFILFAVYSLLMISLSNGIFQKLQKILGPPKNTYQTLFGVIRNIN